MKFDIKIFQLIDALHCGVCFSNANEKMVCLVMLIGRKKRRFLAKDIGLMWCAVEVGFHFMVLSCLCLMSACWLRFRLKTTSLFSHISRFFWIHHVFCGIGYVNSERGKDGDRDASQN